MASPAVIEVPQQEGEKLKIERGLPWKRELRKLEREALEYGMTYKQLGRIQAIGFCPDQIKIREKILQEWIAIHQN